MSFLKEQVSRVSEIKAHLANYFNLNSENIEKVKQNSLKSSISLSKSSNSHSEKSQKSSKSSHSKAHSKSSKSSHSSSSHKSSSRGSDASYFAILERRKTADHAKLIADQEEERANRKLKILEKTLELEKEKIESEIVEARNKAVLAEFETRYDDVSQFSENEYDCESKLRTRKFSFEEKSIEKNSLDLIKPYLKPSYIHPNSGTITLNKNKNTNIQNIDIITSSNNNNNLTYNEHIINENNNNFNLIQGTKLSDNNIIQPIKSNPVQLINIQPVSYNNKQSIPYNNKIQTISNNENQSISENNNEQNLIEVHNQDSKNDSADTPILNSNHHNQSVTMPADKHSPLSKNSSTTDTSQTLFVKKNPVDKFIDDLVEGVETSFKTESASMNLQLALQQEYEMRHLPAIELIRFDGSPEKWPEFIDSFYQNIHSKITFSNNS